MTTAPRPCGASPGRQPAHRAPHPTRIGLHGLEIVMAVGQSFAIHLEPVGKRITTTIPRSPHPRSLPGRPVQPGTALGV
ncbi:hypothetical protein Shyd_86130 [Streptomyces hydrogenans]|uniref:Uncharacterized protein n=1 Tax=Streptomyces hydrogenans TaxID=1873719 RepID=A0ABQ3PQE5_9ACTN|nr:hypothetical protein GCM10018784_74190 [Streptomyces hydrogenans]GHI27242.1 hypothetical protein Shyd_86130 [Streptomyces hydrogenans]